MSDIPQRSRKIKTKKLIMMSTMTFRRAVSVEEEENQLR